MIKFPKTPRLVKVLEDGSIYKDWKHLHAVITEKVDGANSGISFDSDGNLLLQSRGHYLVGGPRERQFDLFKQWANGNLDYLFGVLGDKYILFGEWCYAKHLIFYDNLPNYFLGFDIYDKESERFLSLKRYHQVLGDGPVSLVPTLFQNTFGKINNFTQYITKTGLKTRDWKTKLVQLAGEKELEHTDPSDLMEGVYVRIEDDDWVVGRMKNPRAEFSKIVDEDTHWMTRPIIANQLCSQERL